METRTPIYLSVAEMVAREIIEINKPKSIPPYISGKVSEALGGEINFAYIDIASSKIYESSVLDSTVKHILPFFLDTGFIEEIKKLDWNVIDQRGMRFLFEKIKGQQFNTESSFLIIPKRRGDSITSFFILWGGKILERVDKEEIDLISTICSAVGLRMTSLLAGGDGESGEGRELRRKALELKELAGIGMDLTSLGKEDFLGSFLLNVMGRALSRTAVLILSTNENNTEYSVLASRGIQKKYIETMRLSDRSVIIRALRKKGDAVYLSEIEKLLGEEEKESLRKLEAAIYVPLIAKSGIIGALALGERMNLQPYSEKTFESIRIISNQMVMAIENSKLSNIRYAFSRYVSHQLVDRILSDPEKIKLGGERRKIAILFADIRGFTSMAERMKPEEVVDLLNTYLSGLTEVVYRFEGTLDKYIGDCIMAVFGAPISHYNDVERAVVTAIEMQRYVRELNQKRVSENLEKVEIGIGVHTGYVISGNMGSIDRMDYTVIGDVVNTAARLEGLSGRGQVLVTKDVIEEVKYLVEFEFISSMSVKGKEKPVDVFEVKDLISRKYLLAVEKREPYIIGHFLNIAQDSVLLGRQLGFSSEELIKLKAAAMLIDIGRIGLNESIFHKRERLTEEEFDVVKSHVLRGAEYVEKRLRLFKEGVELVKHHHECYDGSGYPDGLKGEQIPLWARIVSVVDSYHALTSERPFRKPFKEEEAMNLLREGAGKRYDPKIVSAYLNILKERISDREGR